MTVRIPLAAALRVVAGALAMTSLVGCANPTDAAELDATAAASTDKPLVSEAIFDDAFQIVKTIDYVPFQYKIDGCYARALYMSMELASQGIESNAIFAFADEYSPLVVGDIEWSYHVAPMLMVPDEASGEPAKHVLDPSISARPLLLDAWLAAMGHPIEAEEAFSNRDASDDGVPALVFVPGSRYAPSGADDEHVFHNVDIPSFDELPAFQSADIGDACSVLYTYLDLEPRRSGGLSVEAKKQHLITRTAELVTELTDLGKLDASPLTRPSWDETVPMRSACLSALRRGNDAASAANHVPATRRHIPE